MENQLRKGLKRLDAYIKELEFQSMFLEESSVVPMDSLLIPLHAGEELSIDISCNYVYVPDTGNLLQFYGQLMLDDMLAEAPAAITDYDILSLINELNSMLPAGQLLYLRDGAGGKPERALGIRYTMLTGLDTETELEKCAQILVLLTQVYELLGSSLILLLSGDSVEETMAAIRRLLE